MSQSRRDDGKTTATITTIELRLDVAPANDIAPAAPTRRPGPLGLPRAYWLLWGGMLLNRLGGTVFFLLGVYLTHERGLRPELAGLIISLNAAGGLFAGPIGGALADRFGRRATLLVGTASAGALMLALGLSRSTAAIVAIAPCLGFFTDICRPPLQAAVADLVPPADRARAYGLLFWAFNLGFAAAAPLGGLLAEHHFTLLFVIDAATTLAYGAVVLVGVPETRPTAAGGHAGGAIWVRFAAPFRDRGFVQFTAIQFVMLLAFAQVLLAMPLDMRAHGLSTAAIGRLFGFNGILIVIVQPIALRAIHGFGQVRWLAAGAVLLGVGLGAMALAGGALVFVVATTIWTLGEICFSTAASTAIAELAPLNQRGAYQGTYQLAWGTASTCAPVIGSAVLAGAGSVALWLGCLGCCLAAAALHVRFTAPLVRGRRAPHVLPQTST
ncbi:MAG TPA: MFS transporter [Polyangia bacterium]|nr:MFS transporter [Polyangia bacterium]